MDTLYQIVKIVKTAQYLVPRDYETIGGMWTVDTWKKDNIVVQLLDEGYTTILSAPGLRIVDSGGNITFEQGDTEQLIAVHNMLINV